MKKLKILLYGDSYKDRVSQGLDYFTFLKPYGIVTLLTPRMIDPSLLTDYDVLVLPGGADVDPVRYGEIPEEECGRANPQYEFMDTVFLPKWLETGKPIIGICRGTQTLNVALGGSLIQHLIGHTGDPDDRAEPIHNVYTDIEVLDISPRGKKNKATLDYRIYETNSYHHQGIKRLGEGLQVLGWSHIYKNCPSTRTPENRAEMYVGKPWRRSKNDPKMLHRDKDPYLGVPEIISHETLPYIGFQYHPENMNCPLAHYLIRKTLGNYFDIDFYASKDELALSQAGAKLEEEKAN